LQRKYIGLIVVILIIIVVASGIVIFSSGLFVSSITKVNVVNNTYYGDGVSFKIPPNWEVSKVVDGSNINLDIDKNNSNNTQITIDISPNPEGMSNQDLINSIQNPSNPSGWLKISNNTIMVDGNTAYETLYTVNDSHFTEIMTDEQINFIKGDYSYGLDFQSPTNDFNNEKPNFNITLNSFKTII
jgi:hypothetical protein